MAASITTTSSSRRSPESSAAWSRPPTVPSQPYRITILNAPAVNAFALPGGYLYVTRGLLALANDSSEVAAVLAHEMGHVTANHAIERQNKARNAVIVSRVVTDVLSDDERRQAGACLEPAFARQLLAPAGTRGRCDRREDHRHGPATIRSRPRASSTRWAASPTYRSASAPAPGQAAGLPRLASIDARARRLRRRAPRASSARRASARSTATAISQGIDGMVFGDDPSQGYVRDRTFVHPALGVGFTVPEGFVIDNTSDAVLATGADGTALRFDAVALAAGRRSRRLSRLGLGQRPDRGQHPEIHRQRPAGGLGERQRQGLGVPHRRRPGNLRVDLPLHLRQRGEDAGLRERGDDHGRELPQAQRRPEDWRSCSRFASASSRSRPATRKTRLPGGCAASTGRASCSASSTISPRGTAYRPALNVKIVDD